MSQPGFDFDRPFDPTELAVPVSGQTIAAQHASASGAIAHREVRGRRIRDVLSAFRAHGRLTVAEVAEICGVQVHAICSTIAALKHHGWIVGTGSFYRYEAHGKPVKRELYELTARGREVA